MTSQAASLNSTRSYPRLLIVGDDEGQNSIAQQLTREYPNCKISTVSTVLSAIYNLGCQPSDAIIIGIDQGEERWPSAFAGIREAAPDDARIILCCRTSSEQRARQLVSLGADDYVVSPLSTNELDTSLGLKASSSQPLRSSMGSKNESAIVDQITSVLQEIHSQPTDMLRSLASHMRDFFDATGVTLVVEGTIASVGQTLGEPVFTAPLVCLHQTIGQLSLYPSATRPYTPKDIDFLQSWAKLCGEVVNVSRTICKLETLSNTDECSGLPNRRFFRDKLNEAINQATHDRLSVTVLLFDVDDFKSYNDRFGHDVGDAIIRQTGQLFQENCREHDIVARHGGDEFAVMFWDPNGPRSPGSHPPSHAFAVLERFKKALRSKDFPALGVQGEGTLTISGGIATFPWDGATVEALLQRADGALLAAKRDGKNRIYLVGHAQKSAD